MTAARPRVGVVMTAEQSGGGTFQYAVQMIRSLRHGDDGFETVLLDYGIPPEIRSEIARATDVREEACPELRPDLSLVMRVKGRVAALAPTMARRLRMILPVDRRRRRRAFRRWFVRNELALLVICDLSPVGFESELPFIMPIHDLQHRLNPQFPEAFGNGEWRWREYLFGNATRHARRILVDSEVGREDMVREYRIAPERVAVLPFAPGISTERPPRRRVEEVRRKYALWEKYFFYPAQLWKHKNHVRLVEAVAQLPDLRLVLVGAAQNGARDFERAVARRGVGDRVRWLGYVPAEDLPALYVGSAGLVMPTFFGPTNIPIMEAFALGVPVITSDIRGVREQVGDAALKVDPRSVPAIAAAMERLWGDAALARTLVERGRRRAAENTEQRFTVNLLETVGQVLEEL